MRSILLAMTLMVSNVSFAALNVPHSDSGIFGPEYTQIKEMLFNLSEANSFATYVNYGKTLAGEDLTMVRLQSSDGTGEINKAILITGATHGNEYLNIADRLAPWFGEQATQETSIRAFLNAGGVIYILPVLNPDGYTARRRGNNNWTDLNRDFDHLPLGLELFNEPETAALALFLEEDLETLGKTLSFAMDYHCCVGAMIHPWGYLRKNNMPSKDLGTHLRYSEMMQEHFPGYPYGTASEIVGYTAKGSSLDYYYAKYGAVSLTFEGAYRAEDKRIEQHKGYWSDIVGSLLSL